MNNETRENVLERGRQAYRDGNNSAVRIAVWTLNRHFDMRVIEAWKAIKE